MMTCKYLLNGKYALCTAVRGLMVPSLAELQTYCTSGRSCRCHIYLQYETTQAKVPLEAVSLVVDGAETADLGAPADR